MTDAASPTNQLDPVQTGDDHAWARPLFEQQIALLGELAEAGMAVAVAIKDEVVSGEAADLAALANAYAKVARAVRMTILLQSKLMQQLQDWDRQSAHQTAASTAMDRRKVERDREDTERIESLSGGSSERDDIYALVKTRPVSELIGMICHDLGLDPDWPRQAQETMASKQAAGDGTRLRGPDASRSDRTGRRPRSAPGSAAQSALVCSGRCRPS